MRVTLRMIPGVCIYLFLISATFIKVEPAIPLADDRYIMEAPVSANPFKIAKLNFVQRTFLKFALKKSLKAGIDKFDTEKGDRQAKTALAFGVGAWALFLLGFLFPPLFLVIVPTAIVAIITGYSSIRNATNFIGKARTGKALGLGALIVMLALSIALAIAFSNWHY